MKKTINSFDLDLSDIPSVGSIRRFTILGDNNSEFTLEIKNENNYYYNFKTKTFAAAEYKLDGFISGSVYSGLINFPTVTSNDVYNVTLFAKLGTEHAKYKEVRFADNTIDVNSSTGSNSLLLKKVLYQYTNLLLTISNYSPSSTISLTNTSDTISLFRNIANTKQSFSISCSSASTESFRIIKQPTEDDIVSFVTLTVGSEPKLLNGENEFPAITVTGKINGVINNSDNVTVDGLSGTPLIGDKFFVVDSVNSTSPQIVENVSETAITSSVAINAADNKSIQFSNRKNYQWPVNNVLNIKPGMKLFAGTNVTADTIVSDFQDYVESNNVIFSKNYKEAIQTENQIPTIVNGIITVQPGNLIFSNQQALLLAGDTIKIGGYGIDTFYDLHGYKIKLTSLKIALTEVTTTTTSASSASTSVAITERNGIMNSISTVSGIGIDPKVVDPTVSSGGNATGAGTIVLSAAQTLESGVTLTFPGAGKIATITGEIEILQVGTQNATLNFDVEKLLSTSA